MHVQEPRKGHVVLKLTLELAVEIDFTPPIDNKINVELFDKPVEVEQPAAAKPVTETPAPATSSVPAVSLPQDSYTSLLEKINALELRLAEALGEKKLLTASNISGTVLDSYRLLPIQKAIIEFYRNDESEPSVKLATDWQGKYSCTQLVPGTYDIKIKHARFATLVIKDYNISESENKYQDFLLRK
jgi:hypothetical protein